MKTGVFLVLLLVNSKSIPQTNSIFTKSDPDSNGVYTFVEHYPEFPGGDAALMLFFQKNLNWPNIDSGVEYNLNSKILVRFVIDTDGSITNITWIKPQSPAVKKEVIRVLNLLPKFRPGVEEGKAVKVYFNLPITICFR